MIWTQHSTIWICHDTLSKGVWVLDYRIATHVLTTAAYVFFGLRSLIHCYKWWMLRFSESSSRCSIRFPERWKFCGESPTNALPVLPTLSHQYASIFLMLSPPLFRLPCRLAPSAFHSMIIFSSLDLCLKNCLKKVSFIFLTFSVTVFSLRLSPAQIQSSCDRCTILDWFFSMSTFIWLKEL